MSISLELVSLHDDQKLGQFTDDGKLSSLLSQYLGQDVIASILPTLAETVDFPFNTAVVTITDALNLLAQRQAQQPVQMHEVQKRLVDLTPAEKSASVLRTFVIEGEEVASVMEVATPAEDPNHADLVTRMSTLRDFFSVGVGQQPCVIKNLLVTPTV